MLRVQQSTTHYQLWSMSRMILNFQHSNVNTTILDAGCTVFVVTILQMRHLHSQQEAGVLKKVNC